MEPVINLLEASDSDLGIFSQMQKKILQRTSIDTVLAILLTQLRRCEIEKRWLA